MAREGVLAGVGRLGWDWTAEYPAAANAVVTVGALTQAVKETLAQVKQAVNAHGGKL